MMDELTRLAIKYKTDKWGKHHYTPVYFELFKERRDDVKKVLEIGIAEGAGLRMFRDFFPQAQIYGFDNEPDRIFTEERISTTFGRQEREEDLLKVLNVFGDDLDLVIDDGSHNPKHQVMTCKYLFPQLKSGAIYIIEDVSDARIARELIEFKPEVKRVGTRYDDQLIICRR